MYSQAYKSILAEPVEECILNSDDVLVKLRDFRHRSCQRLSPLEGPSQNDDKFCNPPRAGDFQQGANLGANCVQADLPVLSDAGRSQAGKQGSGDLRLCALHNNLD